jgi:HD-GYP domain-containing protein (c-di-GMP phosphodiesterase class II)
VRYAALLHDFGKVGVRENILLKANKLTDERLELIEYRVELQKERLRRRAVERELDLLHHQAVDIDVARRRIHRDLATELMVLDDYVEMVTKANQPTVLEQGVAEDLREIQAHDTNTREFLTVLPWPPELANVPDIAAAHHEKLDGSGYPQGLVGEQIPLASRVMTVCDIYDALTAMDRPYKKAMPVEQALAILEDEAGQGLLDSDMVNIFIDSRIYQRSLAEVEQRKAV